MESSVSSRVGLMESDLRPLHTADYIRTMRNASVLCTHYNGLVWSYRRIVLLAYFGLSSE